MAQSLRLILKNPHSMKMGIETIKWLMIAQTDGNTGKLLHRKAFMSGDVSGFEHRQLSNGIHVLAFRDYSEQTFERCFACFEEIFLNNPPGQMIRLMADIRHVQVVSLPPIISLVRRIMDNRSLVPPVAVAVVHDRRGYYVAFSGLVVRLAAHYEARARVGDDYDDCYAWLESLQ